MIGSSINARLRLIYWAIAEAEAADEQGKPMDEMAALWRRIADQAETLAEDCADVAKDYEGDKRRRERAEHEIERDVAAEYDKSKER